MTFLPVEIIKKKRSAIPLSAAEIEFFIEGYTRGTIPDYQMSSLLMAIFLNGMNSEESVVLTQAMLHSGVVLDLSHIPGFKVDKHSTGGVGDKTSLILGPIVAACGLVVPMISGRGLGHTGGTLDKLESIPGFSTQLSIEQFQKDLLKNKISYIGQTPEICPADKKIYALRDVTGTVESLPLICASIMSKKLAEGIDGLVLDVKFGSGAFMKTPEKATELAKALLAIARRAGKKASALITSMNQPLGRFAGNSLEVEECVAILKNQKFMSFYGRDLYEETRTLSVELAAQMLFISGKYKNLDECLAAANKTLEDGSAMRVFETLCAAQGGQLSKLPRAQKSLVLSAKSAGYLSEVNTESVGLAGILLSAGRQKKEDIIDPSSGIEIHAQLGDAVKVGDPLMTLWCDDSSKLKAAADFLTPHLKISLQKPATQSLIIDRL